MPASGSTPKKPQRSGNPAVRANVAPTTASAWKKKRQGEMITLPSGNTVQIVRPELTSLLTENLLGDELTALALKAVKRGEGQADSSDVLKEAANDPESVAKILDAFDRVAVRCFRDPALLYYRDAQGAPIPEADPDPCPRLDRQRHRHAAWDGTRHGHRWWWLGSGPGRWWHRLPGLSR